MDRFKFATSIDTELDVPVVLLIVNEEKTYVFEPNNAVEFSILMLHNFYDPSQDSIVLDLGEEEKITLKKEGEEEDIIYLINGLFYAGKSASLDYFYTKSIEEVFDDMPKEKAALFMEKFRKYRDDFLSEE